MSTNCIRCVVNKRTGFDLLCDDCREQEVQDAIFEGRNAPDHSPEPSERERLQNAVNIAAQFMDFLRKNTGFNDEWPIEIKCAPDVVDEFNAKLNEFEKSVYSVRSDKPVSSREKNQR